MRGFLAKLVELVRRSGVGPHEGVLLGLLGVVLAVAAWLDPVFVQWGTQLDIGTHAFEIGMLSLPMTLIIVGGGIDLSVGATMALCSIVFGMVFAGGAPIWAAAIAAVLVGAAAGALNGLFVAAMRVHPLLVTLATLAAYRGLAEGISRGHPVSGFPESFQALGAGAIIGVPILDLAWLIAAAAVAMGSSRCVWGAWVYAIGGNEDGARRCGIPVNRVKFWLFTFSGLTAGLCAVAFAARRNTAKADVGSGIELEVITAVVLGGTSIFGGRGTILGTVLGVLLLHELREFVSWRWGRDEVILVVIGAVLVVSVVAANLVGRRRERA